MSHSDPYPAFSDAQDADEQHHDWLEIRRNLTLDAPLDQLEEINATRQTQELYADNSELRAGLELAKASMSKLQERNDLLHERESRLLNRISELEDDLAARNNELRHLKRQLNDKSGQALAAQEREILLIQLLERCEHEKLSLKENLECESVRHDNDGSSEACAKLEDMLESLLALGEQEQVALNAKLIHDNQKLQEILALLKEAEMKQLYKRYIEEQQLDATETKTCASDIALHSASAEPIPQSRSRSENVRSTPPKHALDDNSELNFHSPMHRIGELQSTLPGAPPLMPRMVKLESMSSAGMFERVLPSPPTSKPTGSPGSLSPTRPDPSTLTKVGTGKGAVEINHKKSKWPTPRWNQSRDQSRV